mmetsp:Transcript_10574/g.20369  ORF Transcript_10574/g.20369 Transcript_10574/m.20369 type:complete len:463 (+) Transcript_10574:608-1996(+)
MFAVSILLCLSVSVEAYCSEVVCDSNIGSVCYKPEYDTIRINQCPTGQVCSANQMHSTLALLLNDGQKSCVDQYYVPDLKVDGESCQSNEECRSDKCVRGNCLGLSEGSSCSQVEDCEAGLACRADDFGNKFCMKASGPGESCEISDDCSNNSMCYVGRCGKFFSLSKGSYIGDSSSLLCESGYAEAGFCTNAPRNKQSADEECVSRSDCPLEGSDDFGYCYCGLNTSGKAYCSAVEGDDEFKSFKEALLEVLKLNSNCHATISLSERCPELTRNTKVQDFLNAYYLYIYRPLVINAPKCVIHDLLPFGVTLGTSESDSEDDDSSLDTSTILILAIVLPFFVVAAGICAYFIRRAQNSSAPRRQPSQQASSHQRIEMAKSIVIQQPGIVSQSTVFDISDIKFTNGHLSKGVPVAIVTDPQTNDAEDTYTDVCDGVVMREKGLQDEEESASSQLFTRVLPPRR